MYLRRDRAMIGVVIIVDVAFYAGRSALVSGADIAERTGLARRGIEPVLQSLSRAGLLESVRGPRGGYRLGRPHRDIGIDEVMRFATQDESHSEDFNNSALYSDVIEPCWRELDQKIQSELTLLTLEELVRRAEAAGLRRPVHEPISYSI